VILRSLDKVAANSITPVFKNFVDFFPMVRRPEHEADYRHPSNSELKNVWSYTSTNVVGRGKIVLVLCNISFII